MASEEDRTGTFQTDFARYRVFDEHYKEIGKVDDLFVDERDQPEYIGVKMGFLGMKSTLIPMDLVRINDRRELLEVAAPKDVVEDAPSFDDDETVSPEHEAEIRQYYGLTSNVDVGSRGSYGPSGPRRDPHVDLEYGERGHTKDPLAEAPPPPPGPEVRQPPPPPGPEERQPPPPPREKEEVVASETTNEEELRIQRTEEELRAGTREREAGAVNVRRRVKTDRERLQVPKKREEVTVERVPVDDEPSPGSSGQTAAPAGEDEEEEIRIPIVEEEVVVEKRPVVKEELRIRKDVVEEEEIVEEDVRKEEVEVEDETDYRNR
ncbi:MAG: DUF2382 domain-containing protein [Rubrobacteraceae bacterium]